ncbi:phosphoadenosine phosphosulfate reductase family protein (plasmid) [Paenibacillus peoriae]|uniref:Phosphoadenosine phosphosulfate reductase family protein n=1 Tax=Paenibacillus peoriae TaxID=59893 RepID=A0A7H0YH92_9BACL|nr:phosphoadenosine phosphosulfate reductase family protein [Paenibacillus peoriae]QNR70450.1 phosphoadenosine phosphosulfate reductase family protein [Paenibacillus peoriae]
MSIHESYDAQIKPTKESGVWEFTRADKETRYSHFKDHKTATLEEKERWAIDILKMALSRSKKPVISCSFGIDSIIDVYLTRKALVELGRDPSDIDIVWNDTANEFREVRLYQKQMTEQWNLRLVVTKPKRTLKHIIDRNGGISDDYFVARKGDRRQGKPLSEKCCATLKHEPMRRVLKEKKWDLMVVGLRADESRQRLQAGLRDGEYFYSVSEWKAFVCRPILWWKEKDIWDYVEKENIPYNDLYRKNLIQAYPPNVQSTLKAHKEAILDLGLDYQDLIDEQTQIVDRRQAYFLESLGFKVFTPRTGCMMCPIRVKYGYMQWMRLNYDKVYNAMVYNLGYGNALMNLIPDDVREEIEALLGVTITPENVHEHLQEVLNVKPCTFDRFD